MSSSSVNSLLRKKHGWAPVTGYIVPTLVLCAAALLGQSKPATSPSIAGLEFPVHMRQNVEAGKTLVGTEIQAKLDVATLVNGVVVPEGAILSGEVTESAAKSGAEPSRLAIRMDSAQWKNGAVPAAVTFASKVYLTVWYYQAVPLSSQGPENLPDASHSGTQHRGGSATYPDPNTSASPPYSRGNTGRDRDLTPRPTVSQQRIPMKNVESVRSGDGAVALTSKRSNIKLDKSTTYVLATIDLVPPK